MTRRATRAGFGRGITPVVALGVAVQLAGCGAGRRPVVDAHPGNPRITDEQRNRAMFSIHAYARRPDGDFDGAEFMNLREAVEILLADTGPSADSRVRRAIAKLVAYSYGTRDDHDPRVAAAERLLEREVNGEPLGITYEQLLRGLRTAAEGWTPPIVPPAAPAELPVLELLASNALAAATPITDACPHVVWRVETIDDPPPVGWTYELFVRRRMEDVARSLDPQHWDDASTLFYSSYLVDTPPSCCPGSVNPNCSYTKDPASGEPAPGTDYAAAQPYHYTALFEKFCVGNECPDCKGDFSRCDIAFENLLCTQRELIAIGDSCSRWSGDGSRGLRRPPASRVLGGQITGTGAEERPAGAPIVVTVNLRRDGRRATLRAGSRDGRRRGRAGR